MYINSPARVVLARLNRELNFHYLPGGNSDATFPIPHPPPIVVSMEFSSKLSHHVAMRLNKIV